MRKSRLALGASFLMLGFRHPPNSALPSPASTGELNSAVVRLDVPAAPVPVRTAGRITLAYELHVSNLGARSLRLDRLLVRAVAPADSPVVAAFDRREIDRMVKLLAPRGAPPPKALTPGVRAVVYLWLTFDTSAAVPSTLAHTVVFAGGDTARGATIRVQPSTDLVLAPPVGDGDWWIALGPSNASEHRRAVIRVGDDTVPHLAQRFAIDWVRMNAGGEYARDHKGRRNEDWYGYGEPVRAVADARVAAIRDGIPDNTPGENSRAVPMTVGTVLGNYILLDLGSRSGPTHRFALYGHLKAGSVQLRVGDSVSRGQVVGAIGNSGNSDGPHLHFHITDAMDAASAPLRGEGIPYVLDAFMVIAHDPEQVSRGARLTALGAQRATLPVEGDVIRIAGSQR